MRVDGAVDLNRYNNRGRFSGCRFPPRPDLHLPGRKPSASLSPRNDNRRPPVLSGGKCGCAAVPWQDRVAGDKSSGLLHLQPYVLQRLRGAVVKDQAAHTDWFHCRQGGAAGGHEDEYDQNCFLTCFHDDATFPVYDDNELFFACGVLFRLIANRLIKICGSGILPR